MYSTKKIRRCEQFLVLSWTLVCIIVFTASGAISTIFLQDWPMSTKSFVGLLIPFVVFVCVSKTCGPKISGRAITGGMENGFFIGIGAAGIFAGSYIIGNVHSEYENPLLCLLGGVVWTAGAYTAYRGIREGPVYGWW